MPKVEKVNSSLPLRAEFLKDLCNPTRVAFIFYLPSFLEDLTGFQAEIQQIMKRYKKDLSLKNFPFFLKNGINIHYLTTVFLIDKYRYSLDGILDSILSADRLTKKGREVMKDILEAYSYDFQGFHQMMKKTYTFSKLANLNEFSMLEQVFESYKNHPDELAQLLDGDDSTTLGTIKLFSYLHKPQLLSLFLKKIPAKDLFAHEILLPRILTISLTGSRYGSSFTDFLKKLDEVDEAKKKTLIYFLYYQNAHLFVSTLTDKRRLEFYKNRPGEFDILNEFIDYGNRQTDACIFQNFFVNSMPKELLERALSSFENMQLHHFCRMMMKEPVTNDILVCLRNLNITRDGKQHRLLPYLNSKDLLSKEQVLKLACYMYQSDGYEPPVKSDLLQFLWSFPTRKKGSDFILSYPQEFRSIFYNSPTEGAFLLREHRVALACLEEKKTTDLFDFKKALNLTPYQFVEILKIKNEQGNNALHQACKSSDKEFFKNLKNEEWELLKPILFQNNNFAMNCFDLAPIGFRKWLAEHIEPLKEDLKVYEESIEKPQEFIEPEKEKPQTFIAENTPEPTLPILPKIRRLCGYTKLFKRDMKNLENSTDLREKILFEQVKEKIEERCTASREDMRKILSEEWKVSSLDLACFDLFDSQGTPYRVAYVVKNDRIMILKFGARRDFYNEMSGTTYRQLMQEANEFLFNDSRSPKTPNSDHQHE